MTYQATVVDSTQPITWTVHGIPIRNVWYMLLYAWNEVRENHQWDLQQTEDAPTLDALFASLLVQWMRQRIRIGLGRNYASEDHSLRGIRGRVDFNRSLKHQTFERGEAFCHFAEYSANVPKNQIIRSTMARLAQTGNFGLPSKYADGLRHSLRAVTRALDGIDLIELTPDLIHRQQLGRNDRDYRLMLAVCELILLRQMPLQGEGQKRLPAIDPDTLVLYKIYEKFIANFYRLRLSDWQVYPQRQLDWHVQDENAYLPSMRPDLVLEHQITGEIVVLDTKFTASSLIRNQHGKDVFDSGHLYQLYAYLKSQEHLSDQHRRATGMLLYPTIHSALSESVQIQDLVLRFESVDLAAPWQEIENRLGMLILSTRYSPKI